MLDPNNRDSKPLSLLQWPSKFWRTEELMMLRLSESKLWRKLEIEKVNQAKK